MSKEHSSATKVSLLKSSQESTEAFLQAIVDASDSNLAVLDESGTIIQVNRAWRRFLDQYGSVADLYGVGLNYLAFCKAAAGYSDAVIAVAIGIQQILAGKEVEFRK